MDDDAMAEARIREGLADLGWSAEEEPAFWQGDERPGRVAIMHGTSAEVMWFPPDADGPVTTRRELRRDLSLTPVAGDWVAVDAEAIVRVRERGTSLTRPDPNGKDVQVLAANIDLVLIVLPIDRALSAVNLERLSVMAWDSGAEQVVVLTKADLAADASTSLAEAQGIAPGAEVLLTSSVDGRGLAELRARLGRGTTATMLGASGVGKTSLLNALEGRAERTREVGRDGSGRHSTTTRRLYRLSSGGVLLDVPGIRSLDLLATDEAVDGTFADIAALADLCRFRDCQHDGEPACAVAEAVSAGDLEGRRLASWRAIRREMGYLDARNDPAAKAAQRAEWKSVTKASKNPKGVW